MLWDTIKESLQELIPSSDYALWINPLQCQYYDDKVFQLVGPDRFFCAWVEERYLELIRNKMQYLGYGQCAVRLSVGPEIVPQLESKRSGQLQLPGVATGGSRFRSLHPGYTFEQFMVGESNLLARAACNAMSKGDTTFGNLLFLNSSTGLGKSHLTQAVAHEVLNGSPATRLHYLTAQQFSAEMVKGIKTNTMDKFSKKFVNNCDILLVEDVHTLTGKNKTQEELNTILDYLIKSDRRVILTSAVAPCRLEGIDEDFRSRMSAGLVTQIKDPDFETRCNIIKHKLVLNKLSLDESLIEYLAKHLHGDIRRTESAIIGIKAKASLLNTPPDKALVKEVLEGLIGRPAEVNGDMIRNFICGQYKVSINDQKTHGSFLG